MLLYILLGLIIFGEIVLGVQQIRLNEKHEEEAKIRFKIYSQGKDWRE